MSNAAGYMEISMYLSMCSAERYMEISMYFSALHMLRYMEISMYLSMCSAERYMEISMYLNLGQLQQSTWKFPGTLTCLVQVLLFTCFTFGRNRAL